MFIYVLYIYPKHSYCYDDNDVDIYNFLTKDVGGYSSVGLLLTFVIATVGYV